MENKKLRWGEIKRVINCHYWLFCLLFIENPHFGFLARLIRISFVAAWILGGPLMCAMWRMLPSIDLMGLPVEFEPQVPLRAPSASTTVFGVSTDSLRLSNDPRGNSVPTILLLMQQRLYSQGGLQAEGIFRINAENSQEEFVRNQLNAGVVPAGIDLHCLAGLIKAWFRELPAGILDTLSPEQVLQCQSEEDYSTLVRLLPATEGALLNWAINLMADVVQQEHLNKMNAHNIAMVFAPNMTQDEKTALGSLTVQSS